MQTCCANMANKSLCLVVVVEFFKVFEIKLGTDISTLICLVRVSYYKICYVMFDLVIYGHKFLF